MRLLTDRFEEAGKLTVLDCGASGGSLPRWHKVGSRFSWHGFEPNAIECERLNQQCLAEQSHFKYHPLCLAARNEVGRKFYVTNHPESSSLFEPDSAFINRARQFLGTPRRTSDFVGLKTVTTIDTTTLDDWSRKTGIGQIDFVKLDVQGAELEILQGGASLLPSTLGVLAEVWFTPMYKNMPLFGDIDSHLRSLGFTFFSHFIAGTTNYCGRVNSPVMFRDATTFRDQEFAGQLVVTDALWLRDLVADPEASAGQLLNLACIAELCGQVEYAFEASQAAVQAFLRQSNQEMATRLQGAIDDAAQQYLRRARWAKPFRYVRWLALRGPNCPENP
jgi:FkbM family methyltransferase